MPATGRPAVHVVVPDWIDDPARPSGGNTYDRRVCSGLTALGWDVRIHPLAGRWPAPEQSDLTGLAAVLDGIATGGVVLVDGLIGSSALTVLRPLGGRLSLVILVHLPLGVPAGDTGTGSVAPGSASGERWVLKLASAVITTSRWTRQWLLDRYGLDPDTVHAVAGGVDTAEVSAPSAAGGRLLCVAAVTPVKGHDVLLEALSELDDMHWHLQCVGSPSVDAAFAAGLRGRAAGLAGRVDWSGPRTGAALSAAYAAADVLLVPSRAETYGLVVTEALARGLPVIGSEVGGLPEALGVGPGGPAGLLVAPGDPVTLRAAVRRWLSDPALRGELRAAARSRRAQLRRWTAAAAEVSDVLARVAGATPSGMGATRSAPSGDDVAGGVVAADDLAAGDRAGAVAR